MRDCYLQNDGARIWKELLCPHLGSILEACEMAANEGDDVPHIPAGRSAPGSDAKRDVNRADMASPEASALAERAKPRKLISQGRPREALRKRTT